MRLRTDVDTEQAADGSRSLAMQARSGFRISALALEQLPEHHRDLAPRQVGSQALVTPHGRSSLRSPGDWS
jgi:hypothetical protein